MKKPPSPNPAVRGSAESIERLRGRVASVIESDRKAAMKYLAARINMDVAEAVVRLRERAGLSQAELALRAGLTQPMISRLENKKSSKPPSLLTLYRLGFRLSGDAEIAKPAASRRRSVATEANS
jgi:ribosome-binding protein aMBF1 (putative translation factor)